MIPKFKAYYKPHKTIYSVRTLDHLINSEEVYLYLDVKKEEYLWTPITDCELMQWTGLETESGQEIWEGDIISFPIHFGESVTWSNCVVEFHEGCFGVKIYEGSGDYCCAPLINYLYETTGGKEIKVLGNRYLNPELLEGAGCE